MGTQKKKKSLDMKNVNKAKNLYNGSVVITAILITL